MNQAVKKQGMKSNSKQGYQLILPLYIFGANYEELKGTLAFQNSEEGFSYLRPLKYKYRNERYHKDVAVLLSNFAASAKMLVDHTRRVLKHYAVPQLVVKEYEGKMDELMSRASTIRIIQFLSDYFAHYFNPPLTSHLDFNRSYAERMARFTIRRDSLLHFAERKLQHNTANKLETDSIESVIQFLTTTAEKVEIEELLEEYFKTTSALSFWLLSRLRDDATGV
jgi:hypothetical protein